MEILSNYGFHKITRNVITVQTTRVCSNSHRGFLDARWEGKNHLRKDRNELDSFYVRCVSLSRQRVKLTLYASRMHTGVRIAQALTRPAVTTLPHGLRRRLGTHLHNA